MDSAIGQGLLKPGNTFVGDVRAVEVHRPVLAIAIAKATARHGVPGLPVAAGETGRDTARTFGISAGHVTLASN